MNLVRSFLSIFSYSSKYKASPSPSLSLLLLSISLQLLIFRRKVLSAYYAFISCFDLPLSCSRFFLSVKVPHRGNPLKTEDLKSVCSGFTPFCSVGSCMIILVRKYRLHFNHCAALRVQQKQGFTLR